jgi:hypothetical protein
LKFSGEKLKFAGEKKSIHSVGACGGFVSREGGRD